jgi:hypothetical protein
MASVNPSVWLAILQPWKKYEIRILQTYMLWICEVLEGDNLIDAIGKAEHCNADRTGGTSWHFIKYAPPSGVFSTIISYRMWQAHYVVTCRDKVSWCISSHAEACLCTFIKY